MPEGLLTCVHDLEVEVFTLKNRCAKLESECKALHTRVRELEALHTRVRELEDDPDETRESPTKVQFNLPKHPDLLRPSRARVPTAFVRGSACSVESCIDDDKPAVHAALETKIEEKRVNFRTCTSVQEIEDTTAGTENHSSRKRIPTAYARGDDTGADVGFSNDVEEIDADEDGDVAPEAVLRPAHSRVATSFAPKPRSTNFRVDGDGDGDDPDETRESPTKVQFNLPMPTHPDLLRPSRARVPTAFARGSVCSVESCIDDDKPAAPAALETEIEALADVEADPDTPAKTPVLTKALLEDMFGDRSASGASAACARRTSSSSSSRHTVECEAQFYRSSPSMKLAVRQDDKVGALKKVVVLRTLSPEQLQQLAAALEIHYAMAGEIVFSQGDEGNEFYIIHKGQVEIMINGNRVRTLGLGDYVGERALLFSDTRSATVKAVEDCELWKMDSKAFCEVVRGPILDYMKDRINFQNTRIEMDGLQFMRVVGRGGFGVVKMVQAKSSGTRYALKCVSKKLAVEQRQQRALATERSILAELDHPFIIKFVRSFRTKSYVYFLMELVTGGELLDALDVLGLLTRPQARFYTASIALALEFLNERRIAYLDLKGENCLVDQHGYLKIVDFGVAERVREGRIHAVKGTPLFMAPEVILGKGYTTSADLWSLGVCLYDFMVGRFPFADENASNAEVFRAVLKKPLLFPKWFRDESCRCLLQGLLQRDPSKRLGAGPDGYSELKEHPFFQDFSWDGLLARQLTPPFVPKSEVYAEDQEEGQGRLNENEEAQIAAEDEQADADGWVDPDPTWQEEF